MEGNGYDVEEDVMILGAIIDLGKYGLVRRWIKGFRRSDLE